MLSPAADIGRLRRYLRLPTTQNAMATPSMKPKSYQLPLFCTS